MAISFVVGNIIISSNSRCIDLGQIGIGGRGDGHVRHIDDTGPGGNILKAGTKTPKTDVSNLNCAQFSEKSIVYESDISGL